MVLGMTGDIAFTSPTCKYLSNLEGNIDEVRVAPA